VRKNDLFRWLLNRAQSFDGAIRWRFIRKTLAGGRFPPKIVAWGSNSSLDPRRVVLSKCDLVVERWRLLEHAHALWGGVELRGKSLSRWEGGAGRSQNSGLPNHKVDSWPRNVP
jgi:hypothetical protein